MKKIISKTKTAIGKISTASLYLLAIGTVASVFIAMLSYIIEWYSLNSGELPQRVADIDGLREMSPVMLLVFVIAACIVDVARRHFIK